MALSFFVNVYPKSLSSELDPLITDQDGILASCNASRNHTPAFLEQKCLIFKQGTAIHPPQPKKKKKKTRAGSKKDLLNTEAGEESMNKVYPAKTTTYSNKSASDSPDSVGEDVAGDGVEVLRNESAKVIAYEDDVLARHVFHAENGYKDARAVEEERILAYALKHDESAQHHAHARAVEEERILAYALKHDESAQHHARILDEEEVLRTGFVDKNARDEEFDRARFAEETKLAELRSAQDDLVHANASAVDHDDERLKEFLDARVEEVYHDEANKEEGRLAEIIKARQEAALDSPLQYMGDSEIDGEQFDRIAEVNRTRMLQESLDDETATVAKYQKILDGHNSRTRTESDTHEMHRQTENVKLDSHIARADTLRRHESAVLIKQNTRKNLRTVENPSEGKVQYRTAGGIFRFHLANDCDYENTNNTHVLCDDFDFVHHRKRHLQQDDCVYEKDAGTWQIEYDAHYVNVTARVQDYKSFTDATGARRHLASADCTMLNVSDRHLIPTSASFGDAVNKHISSADSAYENRNCHFLQLDTSLENHVRQHDLCGEGVFLQRVSSFNIPLPHNTEFRNHSSHRIPETNSFSNVSRGLATYRDSEMVQQDMAWALCDGGDIVQDHKRFILSEGGAQDAQARIYFIPESGSQDANNAKYFVPEGSLVNRARSVSIPDPGPGDVRNVTRHRHHEYKEYTPWKRNKFNIPADSALVDHHDFGGCKDDASWRLCENTWDIVDISIDEEYLDEEE